ncbi:MAG TPA: HAD-IC family P-type ATPase, partial [Thermodesulfobacteriota bacterium]|nr:HAD-IC family P-type ATPase [Thermodesulfobacteriota bacterium]
MPRHAPHAGHDHLAPPARAVADLRRRFWISLALTLPVLLLSPGIRERLAPAAVAARPGLDPLLLGLASIVYGYGGWPFLRGFVAEARAGRPGMMTLVALAITVAYGYSAAVVLGLSGTGFFWELATLIDVMLLGHWLELRSVLGASAALDRLVRLLPAEAHLLAPDGATTDVPAASLARGDRVLVKPGEKIPADGVVVRGRTAVNEAMLTGESRPVEKGEGDAVIGGAINGEGAIVVEVTRTGGETYLAQVVALVRQAQQSRSRSQDVADRAARWLTLLALGAGGATLAAWTAFGTALPFALERTVTVMVTACPHALGLAVPLVVAVSTSVSATRGLLIRDRRAFEQARALGAVVFDKTGTLTEGRFGVVDVIGVGDRDATALLALAAGVESRSEHPIAAGIVRAARERGLALPTPQAVRALPGRGVEGVVDGRRVAVVSPGALAAQGQGLA